VESEKPGQKKARHCPMVDEAVESVQMRKQGVLVPVAAAYPAPVESSPQNQVQGNSGPQTIQVVQAGSECLVL
jgi:hypothetical protein